MNKKLIRLFATNVVLLAVTAVSVNSWAASTTLPAEATQSTLTTADSGNSSMASSASMGQMGMDKHAMMKHCMVMMKEKSMVQGFGGGLGLEQDKKLTKDDAKIIAQAALLVAGRRDLTVGNITPITKDDHTFYHIDVTDQSGKVVRQLSLNGSTGFLQRWPEHWQSMEKK